MFIILDVVDAGLAPYGKNQPDDEADDADGNGDIPTGHAAKAISDTANDDCHKKQKPAHTSLLATFVALH